MPLASPQSRRPNLPQPGGVHTALTDVIVARGLREADIHRLGLTDRETRDQLAELHLLVVRGHLGRLATEDREDRASSLVEAKLGITIVGGGKEVVRARAIGPAIAGLRGVQNPGSPG